jgi:hypothetical protein
MTIQPIHGIENTTTTEAERAVTALLRLIGEDPERDGLVETPRRVIKDILEMTEGYGQSPAEILSKTFAEHSDELIILRGINFVPTGTGVSVVSRNRVDALSNSSDNTETTGIGIFANDTTTVTVVTNQVSIIPAGANDQAMTAVVNDAVLDGHRLGAVGGDDPVEHPHVRIAIRRCCGGSRQHAAAAELSHFRPDVLDALGRIIDFGAIKAKIGTWLDTHWDHTAILWDKDQSLADAVAGITGQRIYLLPYNPTAENMARYLFEQVCPAQLEGTGIRCSRVRVHETPNCYADYE